MAILAGGGRWPAIAHRQPCLFLINGRFYPNFRSQRHCRPPCASVVRYSRRADAVAVAQAARHNRRVRRRDVDGRFTVARRHRPHRWRGRGGLVCVDVIANGRYSIPRHPSPPLASDRRRRTGAWPRQQPALLRRAVHAVAGRAGAAMGRRRAMGDGRLEKKRGHHRRCFFPQQHTVFMASRRHRRGGTIARRLVGQFRADGRAGAVFPSLLHFGAIRNHRPCADGRRVVVGVAERTAVFPFSRLLDGRHPVFALGATGQPR